MTTYFIQVLWFISLFLRGSSETSLKTDCLKLQELTGKQATYLNGQCMVLHISEHKSQSAAKEECQNTYTDGQLARIYDQGQLDAIATTIDLSNGAWIGLERDANTWRYDNKQVNVTLYPWATDHPQAIAGGGVLLRSDGMLTDDINSLHQFICEYSENTLGNSQFIGGKPLAANNPILDSGIQQNIHDCGIMCHDDQSCQSFTYSSWSQECMLYWISAQQLTLTNDPSSKLFSRSGTKPSCLTELDCLTGKYHVQTKTDGVQIVDGPKLLIMGGTTRSSIEAFYPEDTSKNQIIVNFDTTLYGAEAVQIGSKVLIVGGKVATGGGYIPLNTAHLLDLKTNTLSPAAPLNQARASHAAVLFNGKAIVCGGWYGSSPGGHDSCEQYSDDQWSVFPSLSLARRECQMVALAGKLFMIGGVDIANSMVLDVDSFDPATNSWSMSTAPLPVGYERYGLAVLSDQIYICGGTAATKPCHKYNVESDQWSVVASLQGTHGASGLFHCLTALHGKLYAVGGTVAEVYDKENDLWQVLSEALLEERAFSVATAVTF